MSMLDFADFTVFNNGCSELFLHRYFCSILTSTHLSWTNHAERDAFAFLIFEFNHALVYNSTTFKLTKLKSKAEKGVKTMFIGQIVIESNNSLG